MQLRGKAMFELLGNEKLLDVVECVLGSELECNPIQHVRAKVPARVVDGKLNTYGNVPWHQDAAVTSEDADPSEIITFWMPLVDATAETGCMELIPEAFKRGYLKHQGEGGTMIVPELMPDEKPVTGEIRKGGVIIMNKYTPHRGTNNVSDKIRWSLDLRYHKTGAASGRSHHPSFVVRSRSNPNSVLRDHAEWSRLWEKALASKEKVKLHRV
jgi:ectoine hydroxylase-related dioxygenase (phytanoyl-CoA dioxygenase family)